MTYFQVLSQHSPEQTEENRTFETGAFWIEVEKSIPFNRYRIRSTVGFTCTGVLDAKRKFRSTAENV